MNLRSGTMDASEGVASRLSDAPHRTMFSLLRDYCTLVKPEVTSLVLIATALGCVMASSSVALPLLFHVLLGTGMVAGGTATLNHYMERAYDAKMRRTANRPLPSGRLSPQEVLWFGLGLSAGGALYLAWLVNHLTSLIGILTLLSYLLVYTPLKRRTSLCTLIGALPGAAPVLMGWAAARNSLSSDAWALYAILLVWQFPHFLSIAWMYREDYARAGMVMLPPRDLSGNVTFLQILLGSIALIPVSLIPSMLGMTGPLYSVTAILLGLVFLHLAYQSSLHRSKAWAKRLLHASVIYLPLIYTFMVIDKKGGL